MIKKSQTKIEKQNSFNIKPAENNIDSSPYSLKAKKAGSAIVPSRHDSNDLMDDENLSFSDGDNKNEATRIKVIFKEEDGKAVWIDLPSSILKMMNNRFDNAAQIAQPYECLKATVKDMGILPWDELPEWQEFMQVMLNKRPTFIRDDPFKKYVKPKQDFGTNHCYKVLRKSDKKSFTF